MACTALTVADSAYALNEVTMVILVPLTMRDRRTSQEKIYESIKRAVVFLPLKGLCHQALQGSLI